MNLIDTQPTGLDCPAEELRPAWRVLMQAWREVAEVQRDMLEGTNFADLVYRVREQTEAMYYI
jgi:hypothetical protein